MSALEWLQSPIERGRMEAKQFETENVENGGNGVAHRKWESLLHDYVNMIRVVNSRRRERYRWTRDTVWVNLLNIIGSPVIIS